MKTPTLIMLAGIISSAQVDEGYGGNGYGLYGNVTESYDRQSSSTYVPRLDSTTMRNEASRIDNSANGVISINSGYDDHDHVHNEDHVEHKMINDHLYIGIYTREGNFHGYSHSGECTGYHQSNQPDTVIIRDTITIETIKIVTNTIKDTVVIETIKNVYLRYDACGTLIESEENK
jgi:hypothetical protein